MGLPQMNPLTAKLMGGVDYRKQLQQQLLAAAEKTDDPAYKQRLTEVANGTRPLRTLMHDPAFLAEKGMAGPDADRKMDEAMTSAEPPRGTPEEVRERVRAQLQDQGLQIPSVEEAAALFDEVVQLQSESDAIVAADRETGWGGTEDHLAGREPGGAGQSPSGGR